jgi:hypothetical protein
MGLQKEGQMKAIWYACIVWLLTASLGVAHAQSTSDSPPTKQDVLRFLEVTQAKERVVQLMSGMAQQARLGAEQAFKQKMPAATPQQLQRVDTMADTIFKQFPVDELLDAMIPIYQKHLTKGDIDAIVGFYSSPVGQKLLKESPSMMTEAMQAGGEIARRRMGALNAELEKQMADFIEEEKRNQKPASDQH